MQLAVVQARQDALVREIESLDEAYGQVIHAFLEMGDAIMNGQRRGWEEAEDVSVSVMWSEESVGS